MAILQKTREKAGMAVSIIIALALLSFIIDPQTLETAFNAMSSRNDVGVINGKTVSYLDFQQDVEKFTAINEMVTGSSAQNRTAAGAGAQRRMAEPFGQVSFHKERKGRGHQGR